LNQIIENLQKRGFSGLIDINDNLEYIHRIRKMQGRISSHKLSVPGTGTETAVPLCP